MSEASTCPSETGGSCAETDASRVPYGGAD